MAVSDDEENENDFDEHVMVSVPSIKEMPQKMTDTRIFLQSRKVPEKVWNGFCDLESYILVNNSCPICRYICPYTHMCFLNA
jgi:hypothetical protein